MARGRYHFTVADFEKAHASSLMAARAAIRRSKDRGEVVAPYRGFLVIIPPEYRALGCLPADQFVPDLMMHLGEPYYVGLLSAAQHHGAAHQQPQWFQVVTTKNRPAITCGRVAIEFIAKTEAAMTPTQAKNTRRGTIKISSAEATALDLTGYANRCGGLDHVATVLKELAEKIDPKKLGAVSSLTPIPWAQRLGYLLEQVGAADRVEELKRLVASQAPRMTPLSPGETIRGRPKDRTWNVIVNSDLEPDL